MRVLRLSGLWLCGCWLPWDWDSRRLAAAAAGCGGLAVRQDDDDVCLIGSGESSLLAVPPCEKIEQQEEDAGVMRRKVVVMMIWTDERSCCRRIQTPVSVTTRVSTSSLSHYSPSQVRHSFERAESGGHALLTSRPPSSHSRSLVSPRMKTPDGHVRPCKKRSAAATLGLLDFHT